MSLLHLPPEIHLSIASHIPSRTSLSALTLTHPRLHRILTHTLYTLHRDHILLHASLTGCPRLLSLSSTFGFDPTRTWTNNQTSLHIAAHHNHTAAITLLLSSNAPINATDDTDSTPLAAAVANGSGNAVKTLLEHGAEITSVGGDTLVHVAARRGDVVVLNLLLDKGAAVDDAGVDGETPLVEAVGGGYVDAARVLIERGASVGYTGRRYPPLVKAARVGSVGVLRLLLENGADVDQCGRRAKSALHWGVEGGNVEVVNALIEAGAGMLIEDEEENTPLHVAAVQGNEEMVRILLDAGVHVDTLSKTHRKTALAKAAWRDHEGVARLLVERGAEVNNTGNAYPPLVRAAMSCSLGVLRLLLEKGAEVDLCVEKDRTAMYWAVEKGHEEVVRLLKEAGAKSGESSVEGEVAELSGDGESSLQEQEKLDMRRDSESRTLDVSSAVS